MAVGRAFVFRGPRGTVAVPVRGVFCSPVVPYLGTACRGPQAILIALPSCIAVHHACSMVHCHVNAASVLTDFDCVRPSNPAADSGELGSEGGPGGAGGRSWPWRGFWSRGASGSSGGAAESPYNAQLAVSCSCREC